MTIHRALAKIQAWSGIASGSLGEFAVTERLPANVNSKA